MKRKLAVRPGPPALPPAVVRKLAPAELQAVPPAVPSWAIRELPVAEWEKLRACPFYMDALPNPEIFRAFVAEEAGQVIATWFIFNAVHVEPCWIHPDHRKRPGMIRQLWTRVTGFLRGEGIVTAFTTVAHDSVMTSLPSVLRLGFRRVPGDCYYLDVPPDAGASSGDQDG